MTESLTTVDALAQLSFVVQGSIARRAAEHDLSVIQTRLLGVLRDREPTMQELARLLELDKSSVTGLIDRAARRGLVERVPSTHDRRATTVAITEAGQATIASVGSGFAADIKELTSSLAKSERKAVTTLVSRMLAAHAERHGIDLTTR